MVDGIVPRSDVEAILIRLRLVNCPMDAGRGPVSLTVLIHMYDKLDIDPTVEGIDPIVKYNNSNILYA
jgi:hypothetical protein